MRLEDLADWWKLRRFTANPGEIVRFRKRQRDGDELAVRLDDGPPLWLRGARADFHMFHRIFLRDEYRLAGVVPGAWDCVVDLGANVGVFALRAARIARRVVAFEPNPRNFERLARNAAGRPRITALRRAVAGKPGTLRLYRPEAASRSGTYSGFRSPGSGLSDAYDEVPATTLDDAFARHGVETCALLKVDIEGGEYDALYAASDATLARVERIHGEYHDLGPERPDASGEALGAFLARKGFAVELVPHRRKPNHGMFFAARGPTPPRPRAGCRA